jgi:hypothetical protein
MEKLKPCPWGDTPKIEKVGGGWYIFSGYVIFGAFKTKRALIAAWNRRPE